MAAGLTIRPHRGALEAFAANSFKLVERAKVEFPKHDPQRDATTNKGSIRCTCRGIKKLTKKNSFVRKAAFLCLAVATSACEPELPTPL